MNISSILEQHECSEFYKWMKEGQRYYEYENTVISERRKEYCSKQGLREDPFKANHKLKSGHNRMLVKQLTSYLLGNGVTFKSDQDIDDLVSTLGKKFDKYIKECSNETGAKGVSWTHTMIDEKGAFKLKRIPAEQIIPLYDNDNNLITVVRYYKVKQSDMFTKQTTTLIKVEVWDTEKVTYYIQKASNSNEYRMCNEQEEPVNPMYHITKTQFANSNVVGTQSYGWDKVPFIPLWYDDDRFNQLRSIKCWVDMFDITSSDFANNIDDFQDVYWIVKNYGATDLQSLQEDIKHFKTLRLDDDGDAKTETVEIPTEAREKMLQLVETNIYKFGQGVDTEKIGDGNVTNVVIRSRYVPLDLKADDFQGQVENYIDDLMYFVNRYHAEVNKTVYENVVPVFDRSMIINKQEMLETLAKQRGIISDITLLENHPLVDDVELEIQRLEDQLGMNPIMLGGDEDNEPREENGDSNEDNE
jgi:SPP1 family phage portal protein